MAPLLYWLGLINLSLEFEKKNGMISANIGTSENEYLLNVDGLVF